MSNRNNRKMIRLIINLIILLRLMMNLNMKILWLFRNKSRFQKINLLIKINKINKIKINKIKINKIKINNIKLIKINYNFHNLKILLNNYKSKIYNLL